MPRSPIPVLLVDDQAQNLLALHALLASSGSPYELLKAESGEEALRILEQREVAVVLLDVHMPGVDGFETARRIQVLAQSARRTIPILFVTAIDADEARVERGYAELGAADFLQKPLRPEVVRAKVATFAHLYRARVLARHASRTLTRFAIAIAATTTLDDVAAVILDEGMPVSRADTCALYILDEAGRHLDLIGWRGVSPALVEMTRRLSASTSAPTFAQLRTGTSLWAETADEYARLYPEIAAVRVAEKRVRAFWSVPLFAERRPIGLLAMGFYEERTFDADERVLVDAFTKQCAQAVVRALRLTREERDRQLITTTLRSIGDAVIATDPAGHVTLMNAVAEHLTGWSEAEARGRPLEEVFVIFSETTRAPCDNPVATVLREGRVVGLANHTILRSRSGAEIPIDDSAAPIRDHAGTLFGVVLVFRDVSKEKVEHHRRAFLAQAGATLASSLDYRKTLATVAELAVPRLADWCAVDLFEPGQRAPQQVAVAHADPTKLAWARALGERYPPDPDAPSGVPHVIRSGRPELYPEIPSALLEAAAHDGEHLRLIRELKLESAMIVPLLGRTRTLGALTFVYAESGRRYTEDDLQFAEEFARRAAMAIDNALLFKDAEDARAHERVLRHEADAANKAKDEFLAVVSHELRTPLNAIVGWTATLRTRKPLSPEVDRAVAIIERNARRQARLIEDLLDVSRIISGKLTLNLVTTNVGEAIASAIESVTPAANAKQISIQSSVDLSLAIRADADRLQQIIWNLLSNAVKFTPKGGTVSVRAHREGSDLYIEVADTGEGIPADVLPHVFEPFRQADASTTRRHGGLGLGLAIVKQLVVAHGGAIDAESEGVGRGATFRVALPARGAVAMIEAPRPTPPSEAATGLSQTEVPRLDGLSVLVVDDEEDARALVVELLREQGAAVTAAASAQEALDVLATLRPDVIVSDIGMPDVDGYGFLRRVRAMPVTRGARTPALALTASARNEDAQRAFAAGFQMHVPKPVDPARLVGMVANLAGVLPASPRHPDGEGHDGGAGERAARPASADTPVDGGAGGTN